MPSLFIITLFSAAGVHASNTMSNHTFLWHDYETFGANTRRDRPAQFAAIRTDAELNEIGEPIMMYCQPANDFLPDPQSCLITGITPQLCLEKGIPEYQFATQIEQAFSEPGTIGVGYNTIRFDDEITRFMFWRNLIDPYAREWQNNCGRWDLLDVVRTAYALRPDGINWPTREDGKPSFKLEHLTKANGLVHEAAHDALSDVRATIAMARLIRQHQPMLFDFCLKLHKKDQAAKEINLITPRPFLHVSGMLPAERGCLGVMWPLAAHPTNKNEIIAWDLTYDPQELWSLDADTVKTRMFSKTQALEEAGLTRLPIKSIHLNKSPIAISQLKTLSAERAATLGIDVAQALVHAETAARAPDLSSLWAQVFKPAAKGPAPDVDEDLYGGFVGNGDRRQLNYLRTLPGEQLATVAAGFEDSRLDEMLFRYRARNFPDTLSDIELARWEEHRAAKLYHREGDVITMEKLATDIDILSETADEQAEEILGALYDYAEMIAPEQV